MEIECVQSNVSLRLNYRDEFKTLAGYEKLQGYYSGIVTSRIQPAKMSNDNKFCYLCDRKLYKYNSVCGFAELVCNGCLHLEGVNGIEIKILDAKKEKEMEKFEASRKRPKLLHTASHLDKPADPKEQTPQDIQGPVAHLDKPADPEEQTPQDIQGTAAHLDKPADPQNRPVKKEKPSCYGCFKIFCKELVLTCKGVADHCFCVKCTLQFAEKMKKTGSAIYCPSGQKCMFTSSNGDVKRFKVAEAIIKKIRQSSLAVPA